MAIRKYSRQREAIKTFLAGRTDHPTADTIYTCLREEYPNLSLGTVYRNLAVLEDQGEITRISTGIGPERYDGTVKPHQHFICTRCARVFDVQSDQLDEIIRIAGRSCPGTVESCATNFYGICDDCLDRSSHECYS